jgi:hypothetical protein
MASRREQHLRRFLTVGNAPGGRHAPPLSRGPCPVGRQGELQLGADRVCAAAETLVSRAQTP